MHSVRLAKQCECSTTENNSQKSNSRRLCEGNQRDVASAGAPPNVGRTQFACTVCLQASCSQPGNSETYRKKVDALSARCCKTQQCFARCEGSMLASNIDTSNRTHLANLAQNGIKMEETPVGVHCTVRKTCFCWCPSIAEQIRIAAESAHNIEK